VFIKKKTLYLIGEVAAFVLAFVCMFLPLATETTMKFFAAGTKLVESSVSGYSLIFGDSNMPGNGALIMAWIFVILGVLAIAAAIIVPIFDKKFDKFVAPILAGAALFILIGSIVAFFANSLHSFTNQSAGSLSITYTLGFGIVGFGICGILSALCAGAAAFLKLKK